jgi:hypothetical protein
MQQQSVRTCQANRGDVPAIVLASSMLKAIVGGVISCVGQLLKRLPSPLCIPRSFLLVSRLYGVTEARL